MKRALHLVVLAALLVACDKGKLVGTRCTQYSDCGSELFCNDGRCLSCPSGPCGSAVISRCTLAGECPAGQTCVSGGCFSACRDDDGQCDAGQACFGNICQPGCRADSECDAKQICREKQCVTGCRKDDACEAKQICRNEACVTGCRADAACEAKEICNAETCVTGCRTDQACDAKQICNSEHCILGCRDDAACDAKQICTNELCVTGCRNDQACAAREICEADLCITGCRGDGACTVGSELCLNQLCNTIDPSWRPVITFTPSSPVNVYLGLPGPTASFTVTPGPHDVSAPTFAVTSPNANIQVSGNTLTLLSTAVAGSYTVTLTATGRAGSAPYSFTFNVITDRLYGYLERASPAPLAGMFAINTDGTGLVNLTPESADPTNQPAIQYGVQWGETSRPTKGTAFVRSDLYQRYYEVVTAENDGTTRVWYRTNDTLSTDLPAGTKRATCQVGDGRTVPAASAQLAGDCSYITRTLTSSKDGRYLMFHVVKGTALSAGGGCAPTDISCSLGNVTGDLFQGSLSGLQASLSPGVIVLVDTAQTAPIDPFAGNVGTDPSPAPHYQTLGNSPESAGSAPTPTNRTQYFSPAISPDGTRFFSAAMEMPPCPGPTGFSGPTGCGPGRVCSSGNPADGVCVTKKCLGDSECGLDPAGSAIECKGCDSNTTGLTCPTGRTQTIPPKCCDAGGNCVALGVSGPTACTAGHPTHVNARCCKTGGDFCDTVTCSAPTGPSGCAADMTCRGDPGNQECVPNISTSFILYDAQTLAELQRSPLPSNGLPIPFPTAVQPRMVGNDRIAYIESPLFDPTVITSSTPDYSVIEGMSVAKLTGPNLDTSAPVKVAPHASGTTVDGPFGAFDVMSKMRGERDRLNTCISGVSGLTGATGVSARTTCVTTCRTNVDKKITDDTTDANFSFPAWCHTQFAAGKRTLRSSYVQIVRPDNVGKKIASGLIGVRYDVATDPECDTFTTRICGPTGTTGSNLPAPRGGAMGGLELYDVQSGTSIDVLGLPGFTGIVDDPTASVAAIDPRFVANDQQLAFFVTGPMLVNDGPYGLVVNSDGTNLRTIMTPAQATKVLGQGTPSCGCHGASDDTMWGSVLLVVVVLALRRRKAHGAINESPR